jgi:hypothetical protein
MNAYAATKTLAGAADAAETSHDSGARPAMYSLVNRSSEAAMAEDVQVRIATACRRFLALEIAAVGAVPECPGEPDMAGVMIFSDRSEASRTLDRAADVLWSRLSAAKTTGGLRPARRA